MCGDRCCAGYQVLRQTRVPLTLPKVCKTKSWLCDCIMLYEHAARHGCRDAQVLVVSCNLRDKADMAWWTAHRDEAGERPWLPSAVRISCNAEQWQVRAVEYLNPQPRAHPDSLNLLETGVTA